MRWCFDAAALEGFPAAAGSAGVVAAVDDPRDGLEPRTSRIAGAKPVNSKPRSRTATHTPKDPKTPRAKTIAGLCWIWVDPPSPPSRPVVQGSLETS